MPKDYSNLKIGGEKLNIEPREVFFSLNRSSEFTYPRDIQTQVLDRWYENRHNPDNIIKLNVGSGKTLVGLLALKSSLNEGKGPALYLVPNKQLAEQVVAEAKALGIDVTQKSSDSGYTSSSKILVTVIHTLFNGKSVFGVESSKTRIGTVVIDDVHACVAMMANQFRIVLTNTHDAYGQIFDVLAEDIRDFHKSRFLEIKDRDPRARLEVPFWIWQERYKEVINILHEHRNDDELMFTYPLLNQDLNLCHCNIGGNQIEIEPFFPIPNRIPSFERADRRIYMTATLSDDSVISTHFDVDFKDLGNPIAPDLSQSVGERMILMPQELNPDIELDDVKKMLLKIAIKNNVVVIVPSERASRYWLGDNTTVLSGDDVIVGIKRLRTKHVGLVVLINRYDGIDLPNDACRVLVIAGLPEIASFADLVDSDILDSSTTNLRRQIERIEQGMGRGVRSNLDYCAVLLLGSKLIGRISMPQAKMMLTPETRIQLELSKKLASMLGRPQISDIEDTIMDCLNRNTTWIDANRQALGTISDKSNNQPDYAKLAFKDAFDKARANQTQRVGRVFDRAIEECDEKTVRAWLLYKKAVFQNLSNRDTAQETLLSAYSIVSSVPRPLKGVQYQKISPAAETQATKLIKYHRDRFEDDVDLKNYVNELCSSLRFSSGTADDFELAIDELAQFIGIMGERPEKKYNVGPDNLWALSDKCFFVIECKSGVTSKNGISKSATGQLGQHVDWFKQQYLEFPCIPIIVHPENFLDRGATAVDKMRVIDRGDLRSFASVCKILVNNFSINQLNLM